MQIVGLYTLEQARRQMVVQGVFPSLLAAALRVAGVE